MEIERKFLMTALPEDLSRRPALLIEQVYLCEDPAVRARRENDEYYLTYKSGPMSAHEEYNLPLTEKAYLELRGRAGGCLIRKRRYLIPLPPYTAELDVFEEPFDDAAWAEVEFPSEEEARAFTPPAWMGPDVTGDERFRNGRISRTRYENHSFWRPVSP